MKEIFQDTMACHHKICAKHYWEKELTLYNTEIMDIQQQVNCTLPKQE